MQAHELFQELSQTPAAMGSVRAALGIAALQGHIPKVRDATQAYIQARTDGPDRPRTWARLPRQWWPAAWFDDSGKPLYEDPVVPLVRALYGHPESGALWDAHLGAISIDLGWTRMEVHPGLWLHKKTGAVMAVYVDDLVYWRLESMMEPASGRRSSITSSLGSWLFPSRNFLAVITRF